MRTLSPIVRLAALLCVFLLVLAAVSPAGVSNTFGMLVLLWAVVSVTVFTRLVSLEEEIPHRQPVAVPAFSPRPPPTLTA